MEPITRKRSCPLHPLFLAAVLASAGSPAAAVLAAQTIAGGFGCRFDR